MFCFFFAFQTVDKRQPWILWSQEPPDRFVGFTDPVFAANFERTMTYRLDSDYPIPYLGPTSIDAAIKPLFPSVQHRRKDVPVVWIASNCDAYNGRHSFVKELMKLVPVDSYGNCLNNKPIPAELVAKGGDIYSSTIPILQQYKVKPDKVKANRRLEEKERKKREKVRKRERKKEKQNKGRF